LGLAYGLALGLAALRAGDRLLQRLLEVLGRFGEVERGRLVVVRELRQSLEGIERIHQAASAFTTEPGVVDLFERLLHLFGALARRLAVGLLGALLGNRLAPALVQILRPAAQAALVVLHARELAQQLHPLLFLFGQLWSGSALAETLLDLVAYALNLAELLLRAL